MIDLPAQLFAAACVAWVYVAIGNAINAFAVFKGARQVDRAARAANCLAWPLLLAWCTLAISAYATLAVLDKARGFRQGRDKKRRK